jgi:hypothetical protein
MKKYQVITPYGTQYIIDEDGCFLEYNNNKWNHPHDSWKCTGIAEILPFNNLRFHSLAHFIDMIQNKKDFTFKNGKPRYTLTDKDHGTFRVHGNTAYHGIAYAYEV